MSAHATTCQQLTKRHTLPSSHPVFTVVRKNCKPTKNRLSIATGQCGDDSSSFCMHSKPKLSAHVHGAWPLSLGLPPTCEPLVLGPAFAMDSTPGPVWVSLKFCEAQSTLIR